MRALTLFPHADANVTGLFILGWFFLALSPVFAEQTVDLQGQVNVERSQAVVAGATVRLETREGMLVMQAFTSSSGQFEFMNLQKAAYRLTVIAEGYQPFQQDVDLSASAGTVVDNLALVPQGPGKASSAEAPSLTDLNAPKKARKEFEKGDRALEAGNFSEARSHLEKAVAEYPCYARAQTDLAVVATVLHKYPSAEAALKKAIKCDPGFPDSYPLFGQVLNAQHRFAESEKVLQDGVRLSPGAWQFYYQLGIAHFGLGEYARAQEEYAKVLSLNPAPPAEFHVKFADLYVRVGAYAKAYAQMEAYLRADPSGRFAARIKEVMRQMESAGVVHPSQAKAAEPVATKP